MRYPVTESQLREFTTAKIQTLQKIMKSKGWRYERHLQSALEHLTWTNSDGRRIEYCGWHGGGIGNRNYGFARLGFSLYDSSLLPANYHPVVDSALPNDDELDYGTRTVSGGLIERSDEFWKAAHAYVEKL